MARTRHRRWLYNRRAELAAASIGTNRYGYAYDTIGNRLWSAANAATNSYTANSLNQYTTVGRAAPSAPDSALVYDADGNLTNDGSFSYSYDAENRLIAAYPLSPVVGSLAVLNRYDHRHRRVQKIVKQYDGTAWGTVETHTLVWDGNNIILEKIVLADGTTRMCEYFWGPDKSGSEQGAGGVGGLLAVSVDGVFYILCYDHNGNVVLYVSETGSIAAQYTYDPYGNITGMSGALIAQFFFGFSTKHHDLELGMVSYQRRFYRPDLGRWLNRDPIEEDGGENLYSFCKNNSIVKTDMLGLASSLTWEPKRSLEGWNFGVSRVPYSKDFDVIASYTLTQEERKCCSGVRVDRYVRKFLGIGGRYGDYVLDHADEGGGSYLDEPYTGYAEGDKPDGQTLFIYRMPWTQAFKFIAICSAGPNKGKQLSSIEKLFKTDGHFFGQSYDGRFVDE